MILIHGKMAREQLPSSHWDQLKKYRKREGEKTRKRAREAYLPCSRIPNSGEFGYNSGLYPEVLRPFDKPCPEQCHPEQSEGSLEGSGQASATSFTHVYQLKENLAADAVLSLRRISQNEKS